MTNIVMERIALFHRYLRAGMTVNEAWAQACLDAKEGNDEDQA